MKLICTKSILIHEIIVELAMVNIYIMKKVKRKSNFSVITVSCQLIVSYIDIRFKKAFFMINLLHNVK